MMPGARYSREGRDREAYAEACGRVRALEKRLLHRERLQELSSAPDVAAALHLLRRWGWTGSGKEAAEGEWEGALTDSLKRSDHLLRGMDPRPELTTVLVLKYDLLNLGAVMKARLLDRPFSQSLHPRGMNSASSLEVMADKMDFTPYPWPLAEELAALGDGSGGGDPGALPGLLAAARHRSLRRLAVKEGSRLFRDYLDHLADVENIKGALRSLAFPELRYGREPLLPGGFVDGGILRDAGSGGELVRRLSRTLYGPLLEKCRRDDGRLSSGLVERETDDLLISLMASARYVSLGPEPIWACWLARETDLKNIRSVLVMLERGLPRDVLAKRVRRTYV